MNELDSLYYIGVVIINLFVCFDYYEIRPASNWRRCRGGLSRLVCVSNRTLWESISLFLLLLCVALLCGFVFVSVFDFRFLSVLCNKADVPKTRLLHSHRSPKEYISAGEGGIELCLITVSQPWMI